MHFKTYYMRLESWGLPKFSEYIFLASKLSFEKFEKLDFNIRNTLLPDL